MRVSFIVLGLLLLVSSAAYAQSTKIGFIDIQRVIRDSRAGKAAKTAFESEIKKKQQIIESKTAQLERMRSEFVQSGPAMNETTRRQKAEQMERLEKELNRTRTDFRDDLQKRDFELMQNILKDLETILQTIGKSGGYTIILTSDALVYGLPSSDVTQQVIQAYDAKK